MANILRATNFSGVLTSAILSLTLLVSTPSTAGASQVSTGVKYKKNTVVDFDESLIEGKSRKPYSAYLYKQQEQRGKDFSNWSLDIRKKIELSKARLGE